MKLLVEWLKQLYNMIKRLFSKSKEVVKTTMTNVGMPAPSAVRARTFSRKHRLHSDHFGTFRPMRPFARTKQRRVWDSLLVTRTRYQ